MASVVVLRVGITYVPLSAVACSRGKVIIALCRTPVIPPALLVRQGLLPGLLDLPLFLLLQGIAGRLGAVLVSMQEMWATFQR